MERPIAPTTTRASNAALRRDGVSPGVRRSISGIKSTGSAFGSPLNVHPHYHLVVLAFLTDPPVVSAILLHLDLPHKPPPLSPARGPPQSDLLTGLLDQTPTFDPAEPDPVPDFDQSIHDDLDP